MLKRYQRPNRNPSCSFFTIPLMELEPYEETAASSWFSVPPAAAAATSSAAFTTVVRPIEDFWLAKRGVSKKRVVRQDRGWIRGRNGGRALEKEEEEEEETGGTLQWPPSGRLLPALSIGSGGRAAQKAALCKCILPLVWNGGSALLFYTTGFLRISRYHRFIYKSTPF